MEHRERPGFLISRLAHLFRCRILELLDENHCPLSSEESALMMVLVETGEPLRRGEFAEIMLRDKTTITRQLDSLESKGLVRREQNPRDRRASLIHPTAKGKRQIEKILPAAEQLRQNLKKGLTDEEWEAGLKVMRQMRDNLIAMNTSD